MKLLRFRDNAQRTAFGAAVALALTFGLVLGCAGDPGPSSGAQPGAANPTNFPNSLMDVLKKIVAEDIPNSQPELAVKFSLLSNALANLDFKAAGHTSVIKLSNPDRFVLKTTKQPNYFGEGFKKNPSKVDEIDTPHGRYDYAKPGATWLDFAAIKLGGGPFHDGFAQEETMTLEMPELANVVAGGNNFTRDKPCDPDPKMKMDYPLLCSPTPIFIGSVHRTIEISPDLEPIWKTVAPSKLFNYIKPLDKNFELNVLAVAVANLTNAKDGPADVTTIDDLFNTFVAGFTAAKENKVDTINTGAIGTGVFKNSTKVVYAMQKLAAMQVGINLRYYGLKSDDKKAWDPIVDDIIKSYNASPTQTVKHLLELAHDKLK